LSVMKKCVAEVIGTFALVFAGTVNPSTIRLSGKSEWRGDTIFLRSNVRMLRMKFLAAQSERLPYGYSEADGRTAANVVQGRSYDHFAPGGRSLL
jgi:hypothetical protein